MADTTSNGLMRLPHFTSSKVSMDKDEPIYTNLFTITLLPPASIANRIRWQFLKVSRVYQV